MANWVTSMFHKLRDQPPETHPDDDKAERDKLRRALVRLHMLDIQADIIARRGGKTHDAR